ncbi:MAG TPA: hypothetical protein VMU72_09615 [Gaiellaceae bacterium]|nr:hypothetical protein [Gaiellaceae bacterium]
MSRIHSTLIALVICAAATAGLYAAVHTVRLGQKAPAPSVSAQQVALRQAKLAAWSRSLHATLVKRPPALPKLPHFAPVAVQPAPAPSAAPAPAPVTYVRAPTVVKYKHATAGTKTTTTTGWSDDGSGGNGGGDGGDSGGGD